MDLTSLLQCLSSAPALRAAFDYEAMSKYIDLILILRPSLSLLRASYQTEAPESLPLHVHDFLMAALGITHEVAKMAWATFRDLAWKMELTAEEDLARRIKHAKVFAEHGLQRDIALYDILPPTRVCLDPQCRQRLRGAEHNLRERELVEPLRYPVSIFTREFGVVPGYTTSLYCRNCKTRYYANYYVHINHAKRTYYSGNITVPFIHTSRHAFMSIDLCEMFVNMTLSSWTSATNCAGIYNNSYPNLMRPAAWPISLDLDVEDVWNGFFLHSLLLDHAERGAVLELEHNAPSQADRLRPALQARNQRMAGPGQEEWNHACDDCCWVFRDEDGVERHIRSTVTDGVGIGCPCCGSHDCPLALAKVKNYFCGDHNALNKQCVVTTCSEDAEPGFRTCPVQDHRALELYHYQQGKAMFQLKHRLERLKVSQTKNSLSRAPTSKERIRSDASNELTTDPSVLLPISDDHGIGSEDSASQLEGENFDDEEVLLDADGICDGKPETGNRSVKARFGRRRSHNEELCVASCGVILGRATFFGSEAPNGVRTFWMRLFPTKASLPGVLWHDNNCRISAMLRGDVDEHLRTYFDGCALPVDVFHFKSKHKESDIECGKNCNPYIWPELRTDDGKWRFNSSAAEQANAWIGGYQAIVREMQVDRYNFFLDEMIKRRNRMTIRELKRKGKVPYNIPREELLRPDNM